MKHKKIILKSFDVFLQLKTNPIDFMRNTTFKRSELKLDPRVANHWVEKGLFPREYETGTWLIFNLSEAFWVKIIMKLRNFNVSLEIIKEIKESLFNDNHIDTSHINKNTVIEGLINNELVTKEQLAQVSDEIIANILKKIKLNDFELLIQSILIERKPYFILIDQRGKSILSAESELLKDKDAEYLNLYQEITSKSHIRISMNEILGDLVDVLGELTCSETIPILTKMEAKILKMLRGDNISKVEIRYNKSAQPEIIEITSRNLINEAARLNDIIVSRGYQNITVKTQNGQITYCENTIKHKIDTE